MKNITKLLRYLKGQYGKLALYVVINLLYTLFALISFGMMAPILQIIFNTGSNKNEDPGKSNLLSKVTHEVVVLVDKYGAVQSLTIVVATVIVATILKNIFLYAGLRILNPLRFNIIRRIREDMFVHILSLPIGFFTDERKGDLMSKMTNDVSEVENSVVSVVETLFREPIMIISVLASMIFMSPQLSLFLLIFLPVAGIIMGKVSKTMKKPSNLAQEKLGEMMALNDETLSGIRVVKAFNAEDHQIDRFTQANNMLYRLQHRISSIRDAASPMSETLGIIVVAIILWVGGRLILSGHSSLTAPLFITYIGLFYQIINPVKNLSSAFYNIQKGSAATDRIQGLLEVENTIREPENPVPLTSFEDKIVLADVSFSYGDKPILQNISLEIPKGKTVALVGSSGAGKSTLADLIPRFHDVSSGIIMIDGKNLKQIKLRDLRRLIGVVSQEPILFNDTIYNNITMGAGDVSMEQVVAAAKVANAYDFILRKEGGFDFEVGDRGTRLSGGEKQRITIARAVLKNPPILILDEATSSLDTSSERIVQDAINHLMKNRTSIVIAHRLSTVQDADEIVVLDRGRIAERGTHEDLMQRNSIYARLVALQQVHS